MLLIIIIYLLRLIASIVIGFMQADLYTSTNTSSGFHPSKKSLLYQKKRNFLIWCIPIYGWIWCLYINMFKDKKFFNE